MNKFGVSDFLTQSFVSVKCLNKLVLDKSVKFVSFQDFRNGVGV